MNGLHDYILWLGEFDFTAVPFREADAVILCLLTSCDFTPLFEHSDEALLRDCQGLIDAGEVHIQRIGKAEPFIQILEAAANSRRFGALRMTGYVDIMLPTGPIQFSAITYHSDAGWSFIAYRGTDSSLAGWKEDFMISFTRTEAQELALRYAEAHVLPGRHWYIGGHSKGSNLALYASCLLSERKWSWVERLYLLDGPGFCPEVLDQSLLKRVDPKAVRILPSFCIIGKLFAPQITDTRIVRSFAGNYSQHAPITWGIDHGRLALAKEHDRESQIISDTLNEWVSGISQEDRLLLTEELFQVLTAGGAETVEHLQKGGFDGLEAILRQFVESSEATRNILSDLPKVNWKIRMEALRRRMKKDSPEE
jgi:hypothetical protein